MPPLPSLGPPHTRMARPQGQELIDPRLQKVVDDIRKKRDAELGITIIRSDPQKTGRANALSRKNGVPAPIVEGDMEAFEARERLDRFRALADDNESIGRWASDRRNAAAAADDTESLGALGSVWRQVKNTGSSLKSGFYSSSAGIYEVMGGMIGSLIEPATQYEREDSVINRLGLGTIDRAISAPLVSGLRGAQSAVERQAARMRGEGEAARPVSRNVVEQGIYSGFESIPTTIGGISVGLLTRNPGAAAGIMGISVAGNEYREALDKGLSPRRAARYAIGQGSVEYLTEKIPAARLIGDLANKSPIARTFMRQLTSELPGEQVATIIQDLNEWATLNPEKPFMEYVRERPDAALMTALATVSGVGGTVAITKAAEKTAEAGVKAIDRIGKAQAAKREGQTLDNLAEAAGKSKLRERDPQAFADLMRAMGGDAGVSHVFVDAEAARAFMQTDSYDGSLDPWMDDIQDAAEAGGDFTIGIEDAFTDLVGTPAWDALRPDMRLSPGGMSPREAEAFDPGEAMAEISDAAPATSDDPRVRLFEGISDKLMHAGFTPTTARTQAELLANRYATRAERMGAELTGNEFAPVEVAQVLPPALAAIRNASEVEPDQGLRDVIAEMKRERGIRSESARYGPSLIEWIRSQGGIEDRGGDLASRDLAQMKGVAKRGQTKLIKPHSDTGALFGPSGVDHPNSPDDLALRAWEAGYFPEFTERPDVNDILDAIDDELNGQPRYSREMENERDDDQVREAAEELRAMLSNMGLDPDEATPAEIKQAVDRYVAEQTEGRGLAQLFEEPAQPERSMTQEQRAELEARQQQSMARRGGQEAVSDQEGGLFAAERDQGQLLQTFEDGPRGRIVFPETAFTGSARIELFKARNLSTFLHESGHLFLEELRFDAEQTTQTDGNEAARQLFADWEAVKAWFKSNGHEIGDTIPTEAHELWARGFERYLMEGKSPSQSLRRAFETFKSWLVNIYRSATRLNAPITDEIRGVMSRLIATDTEIAEAAEQQEIELIFSSAVEAGMGESAYRALQESARNARADANDELLKRVMAPIRARVTQEYKDREAPVRAEVTEGVDARPVFRAMRLLRDTPMSTEWLDARGSLEGLPPQVPPVHKREGADPADIAERAGFNSPEEMIDALRGLEIERQNLRGNDDKRSPRQAIIDSEVEAIMLSRYGDPFTDGSIEEEALALIHNDAHGEVMAAELRALGRQTGRRATTYRLARNWARERVRTGSVNETTSRSAIQRYQRSAAKAGKAAMDAMIAGNRDEAFQQKQSQMINNALVAEAKAALDEVETAVSRLEKLAKRRTLKTTDQEYLERAQALLEAVEFAPRSQASLNRQGQFEEWAREQEADGIDIVVPASFEASLGTTHWSRLTVEKLLGLDAATQQIMHLGRMKQKLLDAKEQRDFDEVVSEATDGMGNLPQKPPNDLMEPGWWDNVKSGVIAWDVALLKAEQVFDWLDQGNIDGVFNRIVFRPIADAQSREMDMMAEYNGKIREAFKRVDKKMLNRWSEPFSDPRLINRETGNPYQMKREQLIAMALNMGNEGNIQRLSDGYGWNEGAIREVLNRELSVQEWQFVQEIWDTIDGLRPEIFAMERRVNGIAPEKVEAVPVETPNGIFRGGYYPAIYDASKDYDAERQAQKASDLFETKYTRATTRASATKERVDRVNRPILLQLAVVNRHVGEVIHDITHREPVMQAHKFLNDRRIKKGIDETLGPEYRKMFQPWLKYIANQWAQERAGADGIGRFMQKLRANTTVVGMGFRFTTIIQQFAGLSNSLEYVGARWVAEAAAKTAAHPVETFNFVMERSGEIRHRMDTLDRDIRLTLREMAGKGSPLTAAKRFAFHGIGYADRVVVLPTWIGAYNKALAKGASEETAIQAGDKAVRLSQGSAGAKDLAAVATGQGRYGELLKLMTMFYSYFSAVYSRQRTLGRDVRNAGARDVPALLARAWWLVIVPPVIAELLSGRGPEEDEDWGMWAFAAMMSQSLGAIPIIRDAARPLLAELTGGFAFDYAISPVQRGIQTAINSGKDVIRIAEGEETTRATRNALETVGYFTGLVPGQIAQSTQFLVDVAEGDQRPRDFWDWFEGITKGRIKDE